MKSFVAVGIDRAGPIPNMIPLALSLGMKGAMIDRSPQAVLAANGIAQIGGGDVGQRGPGHHQRHGLRVQLDGDHRLEDGRVGIAIGVVVGPVVLILELKLDQVPDRVGGRGCEACVATGRGLRFVRRLVRRLRVVVMVSSARTLPGMNPAVINSRKR